MRRSLRVLRLLTPILSAWPCAAQTLSSRPAIFADPLLATDPAYGELVLGQTTLTAALRIFAVELQDSVWLPRGQHSNPDTLWTGVSIGGPRTAPRAHHRLDIGPGRYVLYFDKNERLVAAKASEERLPRVLRREDLVARYPTLETRLMGTPSQAGRQPEEVEASLAPCVTVIASVWYGDDGRPDRRHRAPGTVTDFGYRYTCATKPAPQRALLDHER